MSSYQYNTGLKTLRAISHLLRQNSKNGKISSMSVVDLIKQQIRKHDVTTERVCRAPQELDFIGQCYRSYLSSGQRYNELYRRHFGKGEKTVEEAAKAVGLRLPEKKPL